MKKVISGSITLIVILLFNFALSYLFKKPFIELCFLSGLASVCIIWFFSSEGGFTTSMVDMPIKRFLEKESRTDTHFAKFEINTPFIASIIYTVIAAIASVSFYWEYF